MRQILTIVLGLLLVQGTHAFDYQAFADEADVKYGVESNFLPDGKFSAYLKINNSSSQTIPAGESGWSFYMHFVRRITKINTDEFTLTRIKGDLHRLTPTAAFKGIKRGERKRISFTALGYISSYSYMMPNAFLVDPKGNSYVFASTAYEDPKTFTDELAKPEQYLRFNNPDADLYPVATPASRYSDNKNVDVIEQPWGIIPTPKEVHRSKGYAKINSEWSLYQSGGLRFSADYLKREFEALGITLNDIENVGADNGISLLIDDSITQAEKYELNIKSNRVVIKAGDKAGIFYAVQSLTKLLPLSESQQEVKLPAVRVFDEPRYTWRGMHYDIARNFHGKQAILTLIEQMGRYKLNKLHLHLTDDEGWRLAIPGLPELTDIGANRCFDPLEQTCLMTQLGSGPTSEQDKQYLTRQDYMDIVRFANNRNIEIVPEIDMPGHARAAIVAMQARYHNKLDVDQTAQAEQFLLSDPHDTSEYLTVQSYNDNSINVCMESTYHFINKIMYELQRMHRDVGAPLQTFHMGGDEVGRGSWVGSPRCQALFKDADSGVVGVDDLKPYFVKRVAQLASDRGLAIAGWEDGLMYDKNTPFLRESLPNLDVIAHTWDNIWELGVSDRTYMLANAGYKVVLSSATHLYFDHPYESNPDERGYNWATRYTDLEQVFAFRPDDLYANADKTFRGEEITNLEALTNKVHVALEKPENVLGMQGQLWSETLRTTEAVESMIFPRIISLAERAWHKAGWEDGNGKDKEYRQDWQVFLSALVTHELPKLDQHGVNFYIPPPGIRMNGKKLMFNSALPKVTFEASLDGGETWVAIDGNTAAYTPAALYRSRFGNQYSRSISMANAEI
ncbi:carbohydate-binding domain-containing protein [Gilvimarinus agarilyticus]|uniref:family 20 glycosylhydrolase n=1 Tax=Gilvimarinus sp. 2_MG-2023 TaxID=3062666 RepID=UPI001C094A15|nr:family 20 glycosylhydrolase [Gilvimarinus sp. 2_MG-2023]MBU2884221.1 carbohydate-binding domain-containing protein [Gilvimarinus agarilyticus]MDO6569360.1 family 20 glycosylhydrolase [Gilvimarinus sp. 2_MG-2023]